MLDQAFRKTLTLRGTTWRVSGETFQAVRGKFLSELDGEELVESAGLHLMDHNNTFSISTLRSFFPVSLIDAQGKVTLLNGTTFDNLATGSRVTLEMINDNPESPWLKFYLRES